MYVLKTKDNKYVADSYNIFLTKDLNRAAFYRSLRSAKEDQRFLTDFSSGKLKIVKVSIKEANGRTT